MWMVVSDLVGLFLCHFFCFAKKSNQKKATGKQTLRSFPDALLRAMAVSVWFVFLANPALAPPRRGMFVVVGWWCFFLVHAVGKAQ